MVVVLVVVVVVLVVVVFIVFVVVVAGIITIIYEAIMDPNIALNPYKKYSTITIEILCDPLDCRFLLLFGLLGADLNENLKK